MFQNVTNLRKKFPIHLLEKPVCKWASAVKALLSQGQLYM